MSLSAKYLANTLFKSSDSKENSACVNQITLFMYLQSCSHHPGVSMGDFEPRWATFPLVFAA